MSTPPFSSPFPLLRPALAQAARLVTTEFLKPDKEICTNERALLPLCTTDMLVSSTAASEKSSIYAARCMGPANSSPPVLSISQSSTPSLRPPPSPSGPVMNFFPGDNDQSLPSSFSTARSQRSMLNNDPDADDDPIFSTTRRRSESEQSQVFESAAAHPLDPIQYEPSYSDPSIWDVGLSIPPMISASQDPAIYSNSRPMSSASSNALSASYGPIDSPPLSPISNMGPSQATHRPRRPKSGIPCRRLSFPSIRSRRFSGAGMAAASLNSAVGSYKEYLPKKVRSAGEDFHEDGLDKPPSNGVLTRPYKQPRSKPSDLQTLISSKKAPIATTTSKVPLSGGIICQLGSERLVDPIVSTDPDGVVWMDFEYKRKKDRFRYRIRIGDLEADVPLGALLPEFKKQNCIYPHAMVPKEDYVGHRQAYEMTCNDLGWRLAYLNPQIQGQRGLIQRAVDSYRNSSSDVSLRSRRARKLYKEASFEI